jgi:hypothetical protein
LRAGDFKKISNMNKNNIQKQHTKLKNPLTISSVRIYGFFGFLQKNSRLRPQSAYSKEHNDGKLSKRCGRIFHDVIGENPNVKMGKTRKQGGGGHSGVGRE